MIGFVKFGRTYLKNGWGDFTQIWYVDSGAEPEPARGGTQTG